MNREVRLIKDFLTELGIGKLIKVRVGNYTCSMLNQKIIYFNKDVYNEKQLDGLIYKNLLEDGYDFSSINYGTFCVLHEIGHIATIGRYTDKADEMHCEYTDDVYKLHEIARNDLLSGMTKDEVQTKLNKAYRQLQLEKDADKFAYEMLTSFSKEVRTFDSIMTEEFSNKTL